MVKNITTDEFKKSIYDIENIKDEDDLKFIGDTPTLIDFYADWCGPCKMLDPILKELSDEYGEKINIYKVNIEEEMELALVFGARSVPTLLFIPTEGKPIMSPGAPTKQMLEDMINENLLGKKDEIKNQVDTFNSIMDKIKKAIK